MADLFASWGPILFFLLLIPGVLRMVLDGLQSVPERARTLAGRLKTWAARIVTLDGRLKPHEVPAVAGGALLMTAAAIALAICGVNLIAPALAPLLGLDIEDLQVEFLGRGTVGALLIVSIVAGAYVADLAGWSRVTAFGREGTGRTRAVLVAYPTFAWSVLVMAAMGLYRAVIRLDGVLGVDTSEYYASYLGGFVVSSADALVVLGLLLSVPSVEDVFRLAIALVSGASSMALVIIALVVAAVRTVLAPVRDALEWLYDKMWTLLGAAALTSTSVVRNALELEDGPTTNSSEASESDLPAEDDQQIAIWEEDAA